MYLSCNPPPWVPPGSRSPPWRPCHYPHCLTSSFWISVPSPRWSSRRDPKMNTRLGRWRGSAVDFMRPSLLGIDWNAALLCGILYLTGSVQQLFSVPELLFFLPFPFCCLWHSRFSTFFFTCKMPACRLHCQKLSLTTKWSLKRGGRLSSWTYPLIDVLWCVHSDPTPKSTPR